MQVRSDIAGVVSKIEVSVGQQVAADDELMILESMKMEVPVSAPAAGKIRSIEVAEGDVVKEDDLLVVLE